MNTKKLKNDEVPQVYGTPSDSEMLDSLIDLVYCMASTSVSMVNTLELLENLSNRNIDFGKAMKYRKKMEYSQRYIYDLVMTLGEDIDNYSPSLNTIPDDIFYYYIKLYSDAVTSFANNCERLIDIHRSNPDIGILTDRYTSIFLQMKECINKTEEILNENTVTDNMVDVIMTMK